MTYFDTVVYVARLMQKYAYRYIYCLVKWKENSWFWIFMVHHHFLHLRPLLFASLALWISRIWLARHPDWPKGKPSDENSYVFILLRLHVSVGIVVRLFFGSQISTM